MNNPIIVEEWDSDVFHRRVGEMETKGYVIRQETYRIIAEMNPETGRISHIYRIEMYEPEKDNEP